jgi:predicted transcriptional regulator
MWACVACSVIKVTGADVQGELFGSIGWDTPVEQVLMSLDPEYYELIWQYRKRYEFRRRYLAGRPTRWFVYLTAPVSRLAAVIDLDEAIVDSAGRIAELAEQAREGNGQSVFTYLRDLDRGYALPIRKVREYAGFTVPQLAGMLGSFHPPQGYTLIGRHPGLAGVCGQLMSGEVVRELAIQPLPP